MFSGRAAGIRRRVVHATSSVLPILRRTRERIPGGASVLLRPFCLWCREAGNAPKPVLTGLHALPPVARWSKSVMPMEFLHGRPLSPEELEMIRRELESLDDIGAVDDEIRGIVARNWPHLLAKLPPEED